MTELKRLYSTLLHVVSIHVFLCPFAASARSQSMEASKGGPVTSKVERGITGTKQFRYSGKPLRAKPQREPDASMVIRLTATSIDSENYEARFLGSKVGTYDLRALIEHDDGSEATDLPPFKVEIVSTLPKDQRSDLFEAATFKPKIWGGYRLSICILGLIWLSIPILFFIRKAMRPKEAEKPMAVERVPTFADQLKPLVEAAAAGTLSVREKGRLELLLLHYWRDRISLHEVDMASAICQLRDHPEAGQLVTTVERWLHQSHSSADMDECSPQSIMKLLEPYRGDVSRSTAT